MPGLLQPGLIEIAENLVSFRQFIRGMLVSPFVGAPRGQ